jgi:hypothetical protein
VKKYRTALARLSLRSQQVGPSAFAQILGKFYFFELCENLRRILLNYGEKRMRLANIAFNAAC